MPGMLLSANPKELKATDHSLPDDKTQKKRPKTFGMDVKAYLRSMIPHLESGMKPSKSKDLLSADEVKQWSESLEKLLANQTGQDVFGNFLKSEYSEENIEFWLACEDYKKTKSDLLHCKAEKIYKAFVQSDAAKQINIDFRTRESTAKKIQAPTPTSFDEAQKIIYTLMEKDSLWWVYGQQDVMNLLTPGCGGSTDTRLRWVYGHQAAVGLRTPGCGGSTDTRLRWVYGHQAAVGLRTPGCGGSTDTRLRWVYGHQAAVGLRTPGCGGSTDTRLRWIY
ncbi:hypothetical protein JEQ12_003551 [Ovis aries]|uniref:Regulator of G-protein signaling 1 n=1 Tax=Ovis aries TaxID=9940 RepID=A0A836A4T0_SHEEP|nr:hypothetical protein JEQ12_003551 [Ovis aries]